MLKIFIYMILEIIGTIISTILVAFGLDFLLEHVPDHVLGTMVASCIFSIFGIIWYNIKKYREFSGEYQYAKRESSSSRNPVGSTLRPHPLRSPRSDRI